MDIGALPRRFHPQAKRISKPSTGKHSAIHFRSAIPRRLNRNLTSSRYFRLPSTGLAKALGLENVQLSGYDFGMLRDSRVVITCASFTKRHPLAIKPELDLRVKFRKTAPTSAKKSFSGVKLGTAVPLHWLGLRTNRGRICAWSTAPSVVQPVPISKNDFLAILHFGILKAKVIY